MVEDSDEEEEEEIDVLEAEPRMVTSLVLIED